MCFAYAGHALCKSLDRTNPKITLRKCDLNVCVLEFRGKLGNELVHYITINIAARNKDPQLKIDCTIPEGFEERIGLVEELKY